MGALRARGLSFRAIALSLDEAGVPTKTGSGAWTAKVVRSVLARREKEPSSEPDAPDCASWAQLGN